MASYHVYIVSFEQPSSILDFLNKFATAENKGAVIIYRLDVTEGSRLKIVKFI